jgi:hypothetical protein
MYFQLQRAGRKCVEFKHQRIETTSKPTTNGFKLLNHKVFSMILRV